jgi:hypothetical protein
MSNKVKTNIERGAQTLMGLERASSMMDIKKLERQEAAVIADMVSKGFDNPMEDEGHRRCLMSTDPQGRLLRRFITKLTFGGKPPVAGQVKEKQTNDDWINESLKPAVLQHGGLRLVPFKDQSNVIVNGHGRARTISEIKADAKTKALLTEMKEYDYEMPWATVTNVYVLDEDGNPVNVSPEASAAYNFVSKVRANPPKENDDYSREAAITQVDMLYKLDNHCMGMNPTGNFLYDEKDPDNETTRAIFDNIMDELYAKKEFTDKGQRTRIMKELHKDHSVVKDIGPAEVNQAAAIRGWPNGLRPIPTESKNKTPKIKKIGEWVSADGKVLYADFATAGIHLKNKVRRYLTDRRMDETLNDIEEVKLIITVSGNETTLEGLNKARKTYLTSKDGPEKMNRESATERKLIENIEAALPPDSEYRGRLQKMPPITEVTFVEQLLPEGTVAKDPGMNATWDAERERFVNDDKKGLVL